MKIDPERLVRTETTRVRGCNHLLPPNEDAKFCSQCGQPLYKERRNRVNVFGEHLEDQITTILLKENFVAVKSTDPYKYVLCLPDYYISTKSSRNGGGTVHTPITDDAVERSRKELKSILEPLGLWSENDFGLHAVLYSYYSY